MVLKYRDKKNDGWVYISGKKIQTAYFNVKDVFRKAGSKSMTSEEAENFDYLDVLFKECMKHLRGYSDEDVDVLLPLGRLDTEYYIGDDILNKLTFVCAVRVVNDGDEDQLLVFKHEDYSVYLLNDRGSTVERLI